METKLIIKRFWLLTWDQQKPCAKKINHIATLDVYFAKQSRKMVEKSENYREKREQKACYFPDVNYGCHKEIKLQITHASSNTDM